MCMRAIPLIEPTGYEVEPGGPAAGTHVCGDRPVPEGSSGRVRSNAWIRLFPSVQRASAGSREFRYGLDPSKKRAQAATRTFACENSGATFAPVGHTSRPKSEHRLPGEAAVRYNGRR
jgi:hypothetical protein